MTTEPQKPEANARTGVTAVGSGDLLGIIVKTYLAHFVFWYIVFTILNW